MTKKTNEIAKQSTNQDTNNRKSKAGLLLGLGLGVVVAITGLSSCSSGNDAETQAYKSCTSIADYWAYIKTYGSNGKYYKDAKNAVDRYVADSTSKAQTRERNLQKEEAEDACYKKCTTIAGCETYLKEYPKGRYVEQVKAKKKELEEADNKAKLVEDEMYSKCTTIAACDSYLRAYPNGRYVSEVTKKKAELQKKEQENSGKKKTITPGNKKVVKK